jgi:predicted outer membrane protein
MRRLWMGAAVLALLAGCRTNGERGPEGRNEPRGAEPGATARQQGGEATQAMPDTVTPRVLATVQAKAQAAIDAAKMAADKASAADVKDFARKLSAELQPSLDALNDAARAHAVDLTSAAVVGDPVLKAEKAADADSLQRLTSLSGPAFDAAFLTSEVHVLGELSQLAHQGAAVATRTPDLAGALQKLAAQAHERAQKGRTLMPKACGGEQS